MPHIIPFSGFAFSAPPQLVEDVIASGESLILAAARDRLVIVDGFLHGAYYAIFPLLLPSGGGKTSGHWGEGSSLTEQAVFPYEVSVLPSPGV